MKRKNCGFTVNVKQCNTKKLERMTCPPYDHERPCEMKREKLYPGSQMFFDFYKGRVRGSKRGRMAREI
jgi:hypothetical protein